MSEQSDVLRIDYHDHVIDWQDKLNVVLAPHGLHLEDDGEIHDGYCLFRLVGASEPLSLARVAETRADNLEVLCAWQAGELSEEQTASLLRCPSDPVAVRLMLEQTVASVRSRWARFRASAPG